MSKYIGLKTAFVLNFIFLMIIFILLNSIFSSFFNLVYFIVGYVVVYTPVAWFSFKFTKKMFLNRIMQVKDKAVFITGCDSGFGYLLAKHLDSKGLKVFAGCLSPSGDGAQKLNLQCSKRLKTFALDVTNHESVKKAYEFVKDNLDGSDLWALVNNAGIRKGSIIDLTSLEEFILCMEVNCFGVIRVTKAFLPLIKKSRGRIVNLTSISGRIGFPRNIAYATSKFAAVGFNDSLRHELHVWGIRVISIEPDIFQTPIIDNKEFNKMIDDYVKSLDPSIREEYGEEYFEAIKERTNILHKAASSNLDLVINDIESAICLRYPDTVYRPCGIYGDKLFINLYLALSPDLQNELMNFLNNNFPKPRLAQKMLRNIV